VLPAFLSDGLLPSGIHETSWVEIQKRFASNPHRARLFGGLRAGGDALAGAGCRKLYVNGSFVTAKSLPEDYDACWDTYGVDPDSLDPIFFDFSNRRAAQKARFFGEFFPSTMTEIGSGKTYLDFFQTNKETGERKGIVALPLGRPS